MRKLAGFLMMVLGILQGIWIAYSLFIERLPEFQEPILPIGLTALASGLVTMGLKWIREPSSSETEKNKIYLKFTCILSSKYNKANKADVKKLGGLP